MEIIWVNSRGGLTNEYESDVRSDEHNLRSSENKAWKIHLSSRAFKHDKRWVRLSWFDFILTYDWLKGERNFFFTAPKALK